VVKIGELAWRLERGVDAIRNWIELGVIPPAPIRLAGNVRAWPAAEAEAIVAAARRERILSKPRRPISETNFPCALGKPAPPGRCGVRAKRPSAGGNIGARRRAELRGASLRPLPLAVRLLRAQSMT
jgi:hypothetical protein